MSQVQSIEKSQSPHSGEGEGEEEEELVRQVDDSSDEAEQP